MISAEELFPCPGVYLCYWSHNEGMYFINNVKSITSNYVTIDLLHTNDTDFDLGPSHLTSPFDIDAKAILLPITADSFNIDTFRNQYPELFI